MSSLIGTEMFHRDTNQDAHVSHCNMNRSEVSIKTQSATKNYTAHLHWGSNQTC